jgi:hypothetical protein
MKARKITETAKSEKEELGIKKKGESGIAAKK